MRIRLGHLYPEQLNIYADRGNIAVLLARLAARGHGIDLLPIGVGDSVPSDDLDLVYIGGGQDADQERIAADLAAKAPALAAAADGGAVFLGVCGGYQLLGRSYRDRNGTELPGVGLLPLTTVAGERRMIGNIVIACEWAGEELAGFENHAGRTLLDADASPLGRVLAGFGNDGASGFEGARAGRVYGTYLHGPLLPRNPWFADRLLGEALEHRAGAPVELERLDDSLERSAHRVARERAMDAAAGPQRRLRAVALRQASSPRAARR